MGWLLKMPAILSRSQFSKLHVIPQVYPARISSVDGVLAKLYSYAWIYPHNTRGFSRRYLHKQQENGHIGLVRIVWILHGIEIAKIHLLMTLPDWNVMTHFIKQLANLWYDMNKLINGARHCILFVARIYSENCCNFDIMIFTLRSQQ